MSIRSYFQVDSPVFSCEKKSPCVLSCHSKVAEEDTNPSLSVVHVQQAAVDESMWNLNPSFVLRSDDSSTMVKVDQLWCNIIHPVEENLETGRKCPYSVHSVLEQLQNQCPSFNITETFDRYCLLTRKDLSCADGLVCSIPVHRVQDEVVVDCMSLPRREVCVHSLPWTQIYSPTEAKQVVGNASACLSLLEWLVRWKNISHAKKKAGPNRKRLRVSKSEETSSDPDFLPSKASTYQRNLCDNKNMDVDFPAAVMVYGPHGSGKTAAVYACATEAGFKVSEVNTVSLRSKSQLLQKLKEATLSRRVQPGVGLFQKSNTSLCSNTIILFDEIDVVFYKDHGFLQAVQEMVCSTRCPVVLTCSEPPLEFHVEVLQLKFCLPSELELAIHLSLLSLAHNWPLPLQHSCKLYQYFQGDIRKAILHLQLMLSWEPSDPMLLLEEAATSIQEDSVTDSTTLSCIYFPWRSRHTHRLVKSSYLDLISVLDDRRSEVENMHESLQQELVIHQPWTATVKPSLLDEQPVDSSSCSLGRDIVNTLHHLLYAESSFSDPHKRRSKKVVTNEEVMENIFSKSWHLNRTAVATEAIPVLKMINDHEMTRMVGGSRIRKSRHYFHPHQLELNSWLATRLHND